MSDNNLAFFLIGSAYVTIGFSAMYLLGPTKLGRFTLFMFYPLVVLAFVFLAMSCLVFAVVEMLNAIFSRGPK